MNRIDFRWLERWVRIDEWFAGALPIGVRSNGPHLRDQPGGQLHKVNFADIVWLQELRMETGQGVDHGRHHGHWRGISGEAFKVMLH